MQCTVLNGILNKEKISSYYGNKRDNRLSWTTDSRLEKSILSIFYFWKLLMALWLCKRISLFLRNAYWDTKEKRGMIYVTYSSSFIKNNFVSTNIGRWRARAIEREREIHKKGIQKFYVLVLQLLCKLEIISKYFEKEQKIQTTGISYFLRVINTQLWEKSPCDFTNIRWYLWLWKPQPWGLQSRTVSKQKNGIRLKPS